MLTQTDDVSTRVHFERLAGASAGERVLLQDDSHSCDYSDPSGEVRGPHRWTPTKKGAAPPGVNPGARPP